LAEVNIAVALVALITRKRRDSCEWNPKANSCGLKNQYIRTNCVKHWL